ncbi:MAG: YajQ family cyclic di-GMP-binding protein [Gammaproteobacteria bacterium]|nr:YajQ family cyclic di-GMP-binding protein [Gammaproteobacteria bacterium]MDH5728367.1 YajQ family cyclic di-GMP-binding protein [Gammaproteobacteria bacterium]
MPSFDVVSEVDLHELRNAVDQASREINTRYDFKGSNARIEQTDTSLNLLAESEFQIQQIQDILYKKMAKRNIDILALDEGKIDAAPKKAQQTISVKQGIDKEIGRKIVKLVKDRKLKVQAAIQGEQVRITGKNRDDLQQIMSDIKQANLGIAMQFVNFRD